MESLWGCQQLQPGAPCTATAAAAAAGVPASDLQSLHSEWRGVLQGNSGPAMPPSPQTMKDILLIAAAATAAEPPGSPNHTPYNSNAAHNLSSMASPKTPIASRKTYPQEEPQADSCGATLDTFAGRYGFTVTTTNTCTSYRNARCSHEFVLENRAAVPNAEQAMAEDDAAAASGEPVISPSATEPPAALTAASPGNMVLTAVLPSPAADTSNMMLPPMPWLPLTALPSQASFQQPATPAAAASPQRPAAAASPQCSPAFFRIVSTGMPSGLPHSSSSAYKSLALAAVTAAAAATATEERHQVDNAQHTAAAMAPPEYTNSPSIMSAQVWQGAMAAQTHFNTHMNPLQQLSNYLKNLPDLTPGLTQQQQQQQQQQQHSSVMQQPASPADGAVGLQAQAVTVSGHVGPFIDQKPSITTTEAAAAVMRLSEWSPTQSLGLDWQFDATQQCLASHEHQQRSTRSRTTSPKPNSPGKGRQGGSPGKGRHQGSPGRHNSSGNKQECGTSPAYQVILRRSLRRPKLRGPRYDPSVRTAAMAAAHCGTGAALLGKHRLSNCSSMEDEGSGPEGMPHEWAGDTSPDMNELDSWDDEALASGCLGEAASMVLAASSGLEGFEGFVWPLDSELEEEDCMQLQQPVYACTPAAAAAATTAGIVPGTRRASSMSSDWFRELGVPDIVGSRRCSLLDDCASVNAAAAPLLAAMAGACIYDIKHFRCSDADVNSEVQRGLAYRPVWGVQACVGQLGEQCVIDGGITPDKFYDGHHQDG